MRRDMSPFCKTSDAGLKRVEKLSSLDILDFCRLRCVEIHLATILDLAPAPLGVSGGDFTCSDVKLRLFEWLRRPRLVVMASFSMRGCGQLPTGRHRCGPLSHEAASESLNDL